jgi:hypothetical protein
MPDAIFMLLPPAKQIELLREIQDEGIRGFHSDEQEHLHRLRRRRLEDERKLEEK